MRVRFVAVSALTALTVGLSAAAPTQGAAYDLGPLDRSIRLANRVWRNPCAGQVHIRFGPIDYRYVGFADWDDGKPRTNCKVLLAEWEDWSDPVWLCSVLLHEYGHLAGVDHSDNPRSIMFPYAQADRRCVRLFRGRK